MRTIQPENRSLLHFICEAVERQNAPATRVMDMYEAWVYLMTSVYQRNRELTVEDIKILGWYVEPTVNHDHENMPSFRTYPVVFTNGSQGAHYRDIERLLTQLIIIANTDRISPSEVYREFERIHVFADGNGRVGELIYNFYRGTLDHPEHPPEYQDLKMEILEV